MEGATRSTSMPVYMLQVKIEFRLSFFNLVDSQLSPSLRPRRETNEIENQPGVTNFNLNLILTCSIYTALNWIPI